MKPGPKKGAKNAGRPRGAKPRAGDGYAQTTIGPKGSGKRAYVHRLKAGVKPNPDGGKGSKTVVDHKDKNPRNNAKGNLRVLGRGKNASR
jgi:hypothetical protein